MANKTDKQLTHLQVETNTLENIKMVNGTDKESTHGPMEQNTLENLKMIKGTDKELTRGQMEQLKKASGKTEILLMETLICLKNYLPCHAKAQQ